MTGHNFRYLFPGADPGFQVSRGALKYFWGVFGVKNHDFTTGTLLDPPLVSPVII